MPLPSDRRPDRASLLHVGARVVGLAAGALAIGLQRIGQGVEIAPVGRHVGPALEDELLVDARRTGEIDAEHFLELALVGLGGRPEVVDGVAHGVVARDHDAKRQRPIGEAVVEHVGELEHALFEPVDGGQQHQMGEALFVAQLDEQGAQVFLFRRDEGQVRPAVVGVGELVARS